MVNESQATNINYPFFFFKRFLPYLPKLEHSVCWTVLPESSIGSYLNAYAMQRLQL